MELKVGDVLLFSTNSIFGKIIKLHNTLVGAAGEDKKWTHAAIIGGTKEDTVTVYEALSNGFVKSEYSKDGLKKLIADGKVAIGTPKVYLKKVKETCEKYLGSPYGWFDIFHIGLYLFTGKKSFMISTRAKHLICSEAVSRILYDASGGKINFEKEFNKPYDLITPLDLRRSARIKWRK